jgi:hypothetical protein
VYVALAAMDGSRFLQLLRNYCHQCASIMFWRCYRAIEKHFCGQLFPRSHHAAIEGCKWHRHVARPQKELASGHKPVSNQRVSEPTFTAAAVLECLQALSASAIIMVVATTVEHIFSHGVDSESARCGA